MRLLKERKRKINAFGSRKMPGNKNLTKKINLITRDETIS